MKVLLKTRGSVPTLLSTPAIPGTWRHPWTRLKASASWALDLALLIGAVLAALVMAVFEFREGIRVLAHLFRGPQ